MIPRFSHLMKFILTTCLLLATFSANAQSLSDFEIAAVDRAVKAELQKQAGVGAALGIIRGGKIVLLKGYGLADRERVLPVTTNTLFRWASVSKPITAVATMQLVESGKLQLQQLVREHLPEFPHKAHPIQIGQLLRHQGGIRHYNNGQIVPNRRSYSVAHPFADVVLALDEFKDSPLVAEPGQKYSYSTHGYILLSAVVQRAGGQRFADQVGERIVKPLGMTTLQPDYQWIDIPNRAVGYRRTAGKTVRSTDTDVSWKLGGGGFISNIGDMALFAEALINRTLVARETEDLMWSKVMPRNGKATKMAHGFSVEGEGNGVKVFHGGSQEKAKTRLVIYPRKRHGMVFMSNSRHVDPAKFTTAAYSALARVRAKNVR